MSKEYKGKTLSEILRMEQARNFLGKGMREDGRELTEYRPIDIKVGTIEKAFGSATVYLGDTIVVTGVNFEIGTPFTDSPDSAILLVEGEILPTASFEAEAGPPDEYEIEMSRVVDRSLRESGIIDFKKYVIVPGEAVLKIFVDFNILNDDGNIIDAAVIGAVAALATAEMPDIDYLKENLENVNNNNIKEVPRKPFQIEEVPIANTIAMYGDKMFVDPTASEEEVADALITYTHISTGEICSIQLLKGSLSYEDVFRALDLAYEKSLEIRNILKERGIISG